MTRPSRNAYVEANLCEMDLDSAPLALAVEHLQREHYVAEVLHALELDRKALPGPSKGGPELRKAPPLRGELRLRRRHRTYRERERGSPPTNHGDSSKFRSPLRSHDAVKAVVAISGQSIVVSGPS
jgi:hypothetical protein